IMSFLGAWVLVRIADIAAVFTYSAFGRLVSVTPVKLIVGVLLLVFVSLEFLPRFRRLSFGSQYMPLGGLLSGFFGGLSGMQGALRSAFLSRAGLTKEAFVATGVVIACLIDFSRLAIYSTSLAHESAHFNYGLLTAALLAAFAGAALGNNY